MAWNRNESDPLEARRRQLAELEKNLAEQRRRLLDQMQPPSGTSSDQIPRAEPLVWRNEDDGPLARKVEPTAARKRNLARQTRRDMILAITLILLLLVVLVIGFWIAHAHTTALPTGA
jgi:hypothetical protein